MKLLAETGQRAEFMEMFASNQTTIALDELIPLFQQYGYLSLLVDIYRQTNDERQLLDLWVKYANCRLLAVSRNLLCIIRVAEGQWRDSMISNPLGEIIQLLAASKNRELVQEYGIWLARHEPVAAFTVRHIYLQYHATHLTF